MKVFCCNLFYMVHYMSGLGKEDQSESYIKYSLYTHIFILLIKGCKLLRNQMLNGTNHTTLCLRLTDVNEAHKHTVYKLDDDIYIYIYIMKFLYMIYCGS